ncbi:hypothetical protein QC762_0055880 [Podospora pseudocomata]|uniref:Secreted protein n=1 Tax=Podospora pseudocomata TaxID=2093779 RepID=A0ABR0GJT9_9PEZI|nr:hypothetical protein QC762_0055880 [Podospora pseudocomata]
MCALGASPLLASGCLVLLELTLQGRPASGTPNTACVVTLKDWKRTDKFRRVAVCGRSLLLRETPGSERLSTLRFVRSCRPGSHPESITL